MRQILFNKIYQKVWGFFGFVFVLGIVLSTVGTVGRVVSKPNTAPAYEEPYFCDKYDKIGVSDDTVQNLLYTKH